MTINEWAAAVHANAIAHGWWEGDRNFLEILMLIISELSEACEQFRDHRDYAEIYMIGDKPEGIPIELADAAIRLFDAAAAYGIDLEEAVRIKHTYNVSRPYRHNGKRA